MLYGSGKLFSPWSFGGRWNVKERFEDAGERDADGYYDFYYSGFIYRFEFLNRALIARRYDDTPTEASFLQSENLSACAHLLLTEIPYQYPDFQEAVAFLGTSEGVEVVNVLMANGYVSIDFAGFKPK